MLKSYDAIVVGAGPAGIFAAHRLAESGWKVLLIDKGASLAERKCLSRGGLPCVKCKTCSIMCGWGGAGAFSDGKLTLSPNVGGRLGEYVGQERLQKYISQADDIYLAYGAPTKLYQPDPAFADEVRGRAVRAGLRYVPSPVRHMGSDRSVDVLKGLFENLSPKIDISLKDEVLDFETAKDGTHRVMAISGEYSCRFLVLAPGREGSAWFSELGRQKKLTSAINPVDIGVRVEVPFEAMKDLTDRLYEPKLHFTSETFEDAVRTFCVNPRGYVTTECVDGLVTVNGHSFRDRRSDTTNFALLVSNRFTEPFHDSIAYGRHVAKLANLLGGGVLLQRLGDLEAGRRSTPERINRNVFAPTLAEATPGDLSLVLPHRHLTSIVEMLKALDRLSPGIYSRDTLIYGVEVKFYSNTIKLSAELESEVPNLFAIGDGAGVTRGVIQASASGLVVADAILGKK
ncbi:MAG TPA: FAD-dependent oxidoreductase [Cyanobacteria bacterium UBA8530]|nr:FAD-dependent oxidoreductase [Cyanobacteria bacterium UBA8530]